MKEKDMDCCGDSEIPTLRRSSRRQAQSNASKLHGILRVFLTLFWTLSRVVGTKLRWGIINLIIRDIIIRTFAGCGTSRSSKSPLNKIGRRGAKISLGDDSSSVMRGTQNILPRSGQAKHVRGGAG